MTQEINGRGTLEPTGTPGKSFPVTAIFCSPVHLSHIPTVCPLRLKLYVRIRRLDRQPISDGHYTLRIDSGGITEILKLNCTDCRFKPIGF